jgi:hypothetical protein
MSSLVVEPKILNHFHRPPIFIAYFCKIHVDLLLSVLLQILRVIIIIIIIIINIIIISGSSTYLKAVTQAHKCLKTLDLVINKATKMQVNLLAS